MRKKRLFWNTISSLGNQIITILCGFILPRIILGAYGSEVNGLVSSITQFLSIIAFLEFGVGAVVQSNLYQPLAEQDGHTVSAVVRSSNRFFRRIAAIMAGYTLILMAVYPMIVRDFGFCFTAFLVFAMSISSFAQYYFGITNQLLLMADQRAYIVSILQSATVIANTVICSLLICMGASIQVVKLTTSLIYLLRPLGLYLYVRKQYRIDRSVTYTAEPIRQKWNGLAQHIAAVVLDNTDTIVLTLFSTMRNVSIYSVYFLIIHGVKQMFLSMIRGIQSLLGELWARQEREELRSTFAWTEWAIHTGVTYLFGCTAVLSVPFVRVYTAGIQDADYVVPVFAAVLTLAHACHCLRLPYNIMVLAAGHYRQTQQIYIAAAVINIVVSVAAVKLFGLIGVAVGTLAAIVIQTVWLAHYMSAQLLNWPFRNTLRQFFADGLTVILASLLSTRFELEAVNYVAWMILAVKIAVIWAVVLAGVNLIFYREKLLRLLGSVRH